MNIKQKVASLGPGLLYAGAAIGVSHLVQSTKAGALYGVVLIIAIVIANFVKYPFFEAGPRYASATGKSLIDGYRKIGNWAVVLVLLVTISTMFTIQSAVTVVTAGLSETLFGIHLKPAVWSAILLVVCMGILLKGQYAFLDKFIKIVMALLAFSTILALVFSFGIEKDVVTSENAFDVNNVLHLTFLIGLIGWMPAPMDISIWQSIWANEKSNKKPFDLKSALLDFKVGFWGTLFLAICFLLLGSNVLYRSGIVLDNKAGVFANQLIAMFTTSIGEWSFYIIAFAAFCTMFSTTLTCLDAVPRVLKELGNILISKEKSVFKNYWFYMVLISSGTLIILSVFIENMGQMVKIATAISFVTTPILAWLNYLVIYNTDLKDEKKPSKKMKVFSQFGLLVLIAFALYYIYFLIIVL